MSENLENKESKKFNVCTIDSLDALCRKHSRILFIPEDEKRKEFVQKFADEAALDGVKVIAVNTGGDCGAAGKLGMKDTSSAVLVENGAETERIQLRNDDVKDTVNLLKTLSKPAEDNNTCRPRLVVSGNNWRITSPQGEQCKREVANISKLPPETRKYLSKHIKQE